VVYSLFYTQEEIPRVGYSLFFIPRKKCTQGGVSFPSGIKVGTTGGKRSLSLGIPPG